MEQRDSIRRKEAELLTRTGPGTEMGTLLRQYWQPVALSRDLPMGSAPQAITLMDEALVLYRDDNGDAGLLDRKCAHRCADLSYGRVEDGGLRCLYHGWLFDKQGKCLQQPTESAAAQAGNTIAQKAYPCREAAGAIWAYLGSGPVPLFPNYAALQAPDDHVFVERWQTRCNFLQGNEGNLDPSHTSYLHAYVDEGEEASWADAFSGFQKDTAPQLTIDDTRFGIRIMAERDTGKAKRKMLRVSNFVMPNAAAANGFETGFGRGGCAMVWHVPINDTQHWRYEFTYHKDVSLKDGLGKIEKIYNSEVDESGELKRRGAEGFVQDREEMQSRSFAGLGPCFPIHDIFIVEGQGEIHQHENENLVQSDVAIVRARQLLREGLRSLRNKEDPRGVVRKASENCFHDLFVITEDVDSDIDCKAFCRKLEEEDIYDLKGKAVPS